jgi:hypothetical protein
MLLRRLHDTKTALFFIGHQLHILHPFSYFKARRCAREYIRCLRVTVILSWQRATGMVLVKNTQCSDLELWRPPIGRMELQPCEKMESVCSISEVVCAAIVRGWCDQWHRYPLSTTCMNTGCLKSERRGLEIEYVENVEKVRGTIDTNMEYYMKQWNCWKHVTKVQKWTVGRHYIHSFISNLPDDRSTASSKTIPPVNAI